MIEPTTKSVISDAQIMAQTKIEETGGGRLRFSTKLPSGREVEGVFKASSKAAGVIAWCEAVNAAVQADQAEELARQKRKWQEEQAARAAGPDSSMTIHSPTTTPSSAIHLPTSSGTPAGQSLSSDPIAYLDWVLKEAEAAELHWRGQALTATANWEKAKADLAKWRAISSSLKTDTTPITAKDGSPSI